MQQNRVDALKISIREKKTPSNRNIEKPLFTTKKKKTKSFLLPFLVAVLFIFSPDSFFLYNLFDVRFMHFTTLFSVALFARFAIG